MQSIKKIKLVSLSKDELGKRELSKLIGGATCCICGCAGSTGTMANASANNVVDLTTPGGGYGTGSFGYRG